MNIIYARMQGYDWVSTPSDAVARELEILGHNITIVETLDDIPAKKFDFVWAPYETTLFVGEQAAQKLCIPLVAHLEVIPPWRVFDDADVIAHGFPLDHREAQPEFRDQTKPYYDRVIKAWKNANIKTLSTPVRLPYHENNFGPLDDVQIRFPSVDARLIEKAKKIYSPKRQENVVLTLSRLVPVKRWDLLVEVMNRVQTKVTWRIAGTGDYKEWVEQNMLNKGVTLEFVGERWLWAKLYQMMSVRLFIFSTGAMPPMEAALCGTPAMIMESQGSKYIPEFKDFQKVNYGDSLPIFEFGEFDKMAEAIDKELSVSFAESTLLKDYDTVNKFLNGKCGITSSEQNAKDIIERIKKVL